MSARDNLSNYTQQVSQPLLQHEADDGAPGDLPTARDTADEALLHSTEAQPSDVSPRGFLEPLDLAAQRESLTTEANRVLRLAAPVVASEVLSFIAYLATTAQAGQLGAQALSAFTLARTIFHITGMSLVVGLGSGVDTFAGQVFGAGQYGLVGTYTQRACAINILVALLVLAGWWGWAGELMLALGQEPGVVAEARSILAIMSPSLLGWAFMTPAHGYFASQGVMPPLTVLSALGVVATPVTNHVLSHTFGWGIRGIAAGYNLLAVFDVLGIAICMVWLHRNQRPDAKTWSGWQLQAAVSEWSGYLHIAVPSMAMICLDWWCFEVVILIAGLQPHADVQLGAMGVMFATHALCFTLISGFGTAAATRTSNELGAGHGAAARRATIVVVVVGFLLALPLALALYLGRTPWARLYTSDAEVLETITSCMFFLCCSVAADSVNAVLSGVLRGSGHQYIGFAINLVTLWLVGIPIAYVWDLQWGLGAKGVWMALAGASVLQAALLLLTVSCWDWDRQAQRAQQLAASGHGVSKDTLAAAAGGPGGHHGVYEPLLGAEHA